tara:strand:- start:106 stop:465 length:360 start_codon:yes stop_codon:yes gene_type:complete
MKNIELTSNYLKKLKKQLVNRKITPYDLAHASFRKNNADVIIKDVNRKELIITFLDGSKEQFKKSRIKAFFKYIENLNHCYYVSRKSYINRYFKVVNAFRKHRAKNKKLSPYSIEALIK